MGKNYANSDDFFFFFNLFFAGDDERETLVCYNRGTGLIPPLLANHISQVHKM